MATRLGETLACPIDAFWWLGYLGVSDIARRTDALANGVDVVVFDTETHGGGGGVGQLIVQLAFVAYRGGKEAYRRSHLVQLPIGLSIMPRAREVHKISDAMLLQRGRHAVHELENFFWWTRLAKRVVAHNMAFDARAVRNTCAVFGINCALCDEKLFCTMVSAKHLAGLVNKRGRPKNPKNSELYKLFNGHEPEETLHDALADAKVTADNYFNGLHEGWWEHPE